MFSSTGAAPTLPRRRSSRRPRDRSPAPSPWPGPAPMRHRPVVGRVRRCQRRVSSRSPPRRGLTGMEARTRRGPSSRRWGRSAPRSRARSARAARHGWRRRRRQGGRRRCRSAATLRSPATMVWASLAHARACSREGGEERQLEREVPVVERASVGDVDRRHPQSDRCLDDGGDEPWLAVEGLVVEVARRPHVDDGVAGDDGDAVVGVGADVLDAVPVVIEQAPGVVGDGRGLGLLEAQHVGPGAGQEPSSAGSRARNEFRFHVASRSWSGAGPLGDIAGRAARAASLRARRASGTSLSLEPGVAHGGRPADGVPSSGVTRSAVRGVAQHAGEVGGVRARRAAVVRTPSGTASRSLRSTDPIASSTRYTAPPAGS